MNKKFKGGNMNHYYELYQEKCRILDDSIKEYQGTMKDAKKLRGALATELLRQELINYFYQKGITVNVSTGNSYIIGSKYEYDLLLVKSDARPFCNLIYYPEDVIAVIESKAGGLFDVDKETDNIAKAVNKAWELNRNIKFGYITLSENVPKNTLNLKGRPTVKHWELTKEFLSKKVQAFSSIYAVTLHQGDTICNEGSDEEFMDFVESLVSLSNEIS